MPPLRQDILIENVVAALVPARRNRILWARPFSDTTFSRRRTVESPVVFALHMMLPIVIPLTIEI